MDINGSQKVLLITSGQPSLNPRLVKEADALAAAGYEVTVLYAYWNDWGAKLDWELLKTRNWKALCIGGDPVDKNLTFLFSRLVHKLGKFITKNIGLIGYFPEIAIARSSYFLIREAKKHKADLYIGHNLGALPAVVKAGRKYNKKSGFDAEDFHRQEIDDYSNSYHHRISKYLEDKYLEQVHYITASSPQIAEAYQQLYPGIELTTVLNVFSVNSPAKQRAINNSSPIKLFWFSQTIGTNRGLNSIARALKFLNVQAFELHLLGHISDDYKQEFINNELLGMKNVFFYKPIQPDELPGFAAQFDIGLALEPGFSKNNNIALSNKLFTYLLAGLTIVASDTPAQKWFLGEYSQVGDLYEKDDTESLIKILSNYQADRKKLSDTSNAALKLGIEKLNWENESKKFMAIIKKKLNNS